MSNLEIVSNNLVSSILPITELMSFVLGFGFLILFVKLMFKSISSEPVAENQTDVSKEEPKVIAVVSKIHLDEKIEDKKIKILKEIEELKSYDLDLEDKVWIERIESTQIDKAIQNLVFKKNSKEIQENVKKELDLIFETLVKIKEKQISDVLLKQSGNQRFLKEKLTRI